MARLALARCEAARQLTTQILGLEKEIAALVEDLAPSPLQIPGCAAPTAAKILVETTGVTPVP